MIHTYRFSLTLSGHELNKGLRVMHCKCNAFYDSPVPQTTVLWCSHKLDGCKVVAYGSKAHRLAVYPRCEHVYSQQSAHRSLLLGSQPSPPRRPDRRTSVRSAPGRTAGASHDPEYAGSAQLCRACKTSTFWFCPGCRQAEGGEGGAGFYCLSKNRSCYKDNHRKRCRTHA